MIQILADNVLAYDSRLEDYDLQALLTTSRRWASTVSRMVTISVCCPSLTEWMIISC